MFVTVYDIVKYKIKITCREVKNIDGRMYNLYYGFGWITLKVKDVIKKTVGLGVDNSGLNWGDMIMAHDISVLILVIAGTDDQ